MNLVSRLKAVEIDFLCLGNFMIPQGYNEIAACLLI